MADNLPWDMYAKLAQVYLDREAFQGTSMTGELLANAARKTYETQNRFISPEFALAQGQLESSMGTRGRSPVNNPFNVGEFDSGTTQTFNSPQEGIQAYYDLIAQDYLRGDKTLDNLQDNFVNYRGDRYATNPEYEKTLRDQMGYVQRYIKRRK